MVGIWTIGATAAGNTAWVPPKAVMAIPMVITWFFAATLYPSAMPFPWSIFISLQKKIARPKRSG